MTIRLALAECATGRPWSQGNLRAALAWSLDVSEVEVQPHLAYWARFDLRGAAMPQLLFHLEETMRRVRRVWELHFLIAFPFLFAQSEFDDLHRELFGADDAFGSYRLLLGLGNRTIEGNRALWRLSRAALRNPGLNATRIGEVAFEILSRARFANERLVATFSGLLALNYGWSAFASARDVEPTNAAEQVRQALAIRSPSVFSHTAAIAGEMATYSNERHYELVLEQLLTGIRAAARRVDPAN